MYRAGGGDGSSGAAAVQHDGGLSAMPRCGGVESAAASPGDSAGCAAEKLQMCFQRGLLGVRQAAPSAEVLAGTEEVPLRQCWLRRTAPSYATVRCSPPPTAWCDKPSPPALSWPPPHHRQPPPAALDLPAGCRHGGARPGHRSDQPPPIPSQPPASSATSSTASPGRAGRAPPDTSRTKAPVSAAPSPPPSCVSANRTWAQCVSGSGADSHTLGRGGDRPLHYMH